MEIELKGAGGPAGGRRGGAKDSEEPSLAAGLPSFLSLLSLRPPARLLSLAAAAGGGGGPPEQEAGMAEKARFRARWMIDGVRAVCAVACLRVSSPSSFRARPE